MRNSICCCFVNNIRTAILILSFFCIVSLFANLLLPFTSAVYFPTLLPKHFANDQTVSVDRPKRAASFNDSLLSVSEGVPIVDQNGDNSTAALIAEMERIDSAEADFEDQAGHPIASESSLEEAIEKANFEPVLPNTRRIILTLATTTTPTPTVKNVIKMNEDWPDVAETESVVPETTAAASKRNSIKFAVEDKNENMDVSVESDVKGDEQKRVDPSVLTSYIGSIFVGRSHLEELMDCFYLAAPGFGILIGYLIVTVTIRKIGSHKLIFGALLLSSITTFAIPLVADEGIIALCIVRLVHGLAFSPVFAFIGRNAVAWAALSDQLWFLTTGIAAITATPVFSWGIVAALGDSFVSFYIHGIISFALALVWLLVFRDTPQKHRWVNGLEINKILTGKQQNNRLMERNMGATLCHSVSTIAIWIAAFGYFFAFALFAIFLPLYNSAILGVPTAEALSSAVVPFVVMTFVHWATYVMNKYVGCWGLTTKVRVFNTLAFGLSAVSFLALAVAAALHASSDYLTLNSIIQVCTLPPLGFAAAGFQQSAIVVGRYYTQHIVSHFQLFFGLAFIFAPALVLLVTPENTLSYWRFTFLAACAVLILTCVVFVIFGRGQPALWAENSWDPTASHRMLQPVRMADDGECGILEIRTTHDTLRLT